jgi:hypothetical protein
VKLNVDLAAESFVLRRLLPVGMVIVEIVAAIAGRAGHGGSPFVDVVALALERTAERQIRTILD